MAGLNHKGLKASMKLIGPEPKLTIHEEIARELTAEGFFAHPYHSWERGLNENTNGLIRQYIPNGKDIDHLSDEDVAEIIEKINKRARKCLGFKTPNQLFLGLNHSVVVAS